MDNFHLCPFCRKKYKPKKFGFWCTDIDGFNIFIDLNTNRNVERISNPIVRTQLVNRRARLERRRIDSRLVNQIIPCCEIQ